MFWTGRVEYDGRFIIIAGIGISRLLWWVYVIFLASVAAIIVVVSIFIILYRDIFLVSLTIVWFGVGDLMLQSMKDFQSYGGFLCKPLDQLANASGER